MKKKSEKPQQASSRLPPPSDAELDEINGMLDWHAGTLLPDGRLLGRLAKKPGKRPEPQQIPDWRISQLHKMINLSQKSVLEIGCFEGIHTAGLVHYCPDVTAIDVRPQNVMKTLARLSWHGLSAKVFQADAEELGPEFSSFDVIFHVGVLYHLKSPVEHLRALGAMCTYLYLDTHVAAGDGKTALTIAGNTYRGTLYTERGWKDPFSGKDSHSFWLSRDSLLLALKHAGFSKARILQERDERNGPRALLLARRYEKPGRKA